MLTPEERKTVAGMTRIMQIIIVALAAGVSSYLAFAVFTRSERGDNDRLAMMGVALAVGSSAIALLLPAFIAGQHRHAVADGVNPSTGQPVTGDDATLLLGGLQVRKIIRAALFEGAAFLNIFVYQSGGPIYSLGIAVALTLAIASLFPFRRLVEEWLDRELRTVRELRDLRR